MTVTNAVDVSSMSQHQTPEDEESRTTVGPRSKMRIELIAVIGAALVWGGWASSELNTIKASQFSYAELTGKIRAEVAVLSLKVEQLEKKGSEPTQQIQRALDKLSEELRVHQALTEKFLKNGQP